MRSTTYTMGRDSFKKKIDSASQPINDLFPIETLKVVSRFQGWITIIEILYNRV